MTLAPKALFDPEPLRGLARPTLGQAARSGMLMVLGGTQPIDDVDLAAVGRDGIDVRRRRGGGGAVLLHPEDLWMELWLPRASAEPIDVRSTARGVGAWWRTVLSAAGVECEVHQGAVVHPEQGAIACFAALGPGEVTVGGAKLVGISQWRVREGTLVSSVLAGAPPAELSKYLTRRAPRLANAIWLSETASRSSAGELAEAFAHEVAMVTPDVEVAPLRFT